MVYIKKPTMDISRMIFADYCVKAETLLATSYPAIQYHLRCWNTRALVGSDKGVLLVIHADFSNQECLTAIAKKLHSQRHRHRPANCAVRLYFFFSCLLHLLQRL